VTNPTRPQDPKRKLDLRKLHLEAGGHKKPEDGMCVMEAVAYVQGRPLVRSAPDSPGWRQLAGVFCRTLIARLTRPRPRLASSCGVDAE
jgi:hypothetical protein